MNAKIQGLIEKLFSLHRLTFDEYLALIEGRDEETQNYLASLARQVTVERFGKGIFIRGLIEISNICRNDCLYCGIRTSNRGCERYRLSEEDILACCDEGARLGIATFVLQGGEDGHFTDERLVSLVKEIKKRHAQCAITLSLGERSTDSYKTLKEVGADRYLLRHETATKEHYERLHPSEMSFENRMRCLFDLKALGYQVGCGFMVGSPYQTSAHLAADLTFIQDFTPQMCGIGPFLPHGQTPFAAFPLGDAGLTCYLLSILRLMHPDLLLPATTALSSVGDDGRERGILSGANVVMPNLSPPSVRAKYALYDGKKYSGSEAAEHLDDLARRFAAIDREISLTRGDHISTITEKRKEICI